MNAKPLFFGRPRDPRIERAVFGATVELLTFAGLEKTTIAAVAKRSGVARATIYLRWPNKSALIAAALRSAIGREPILASGDIEMDLHRAMEQVYSIATEPAFIAVLPALYRAFITAGELAPGVTFDTTFPGRASFAKQYTQLAGVQGFRTDVSPALGIDLLIGLVLGSVLATGKPPTRKEANEAVNTVIAGLRRPG